MNRTLCAAALAAASVATASADDAPVHLAPHRAVYELSLASSSGSRTIESARGRIAFEFTGDACEGYTLNFRQVTVLQSAETGERTSDLRTGNFEGGDGRSFRFRNETDQNGQSQIVDGTAEKTAVPEIAVRLKSPAREQISLPGDAAFPNAQMRDLIRAAKAGQTTMTERVFDGSDDGKKVYETLSIIGKRIEAGATDGLEAAARQDKLAGLARWPVRISYFTPGRKDETPVYVLSFDVYENGVSRALKLDYGDFSLNGEMTRLDLLPESACKR